MRIRRVDRGPRVDADAGVGLREDAVRGGPSQMRLEDLSDVHPARHAERVEHDVDGPAVLEERHVLFGDDLRDHALVAVPAGELVALGDLALLGDEHADELVDSRRQIVAGVTREGLDADHLAALAVRDLERRVADLARLLLEDGADQLLLCGQLGLALRRHLADEQVAGRRPRPRSGRRLARRDSRATPRTGSGCRA